MMCICNVSSLSQQNTGSITKTPSTFLKIFFFFCFFPSRRAWALSRFSHSSWASLSLCARYGHSSLSQYFGFLRNHYIKYFGFLRNHYISTCLLLLACVCVCERERERMEKALTKVGSLKVGNLWIAKKAKEEFSNISEDISVSELYFFSLCLMFLFLSVLC